MKQGEKNRLTEEQEKERERRLVDALLFGIRARRRNPSIRKEDVIAAGRAAYRADPEKGGH